MIDKNDYFEFILTNPRALCEDKQIDDITLPYSKIVAAHTKNLTFLQATLNDVQEKSIKVTTKEGEEQEINFDYLIIATGVQ